MRQVTRRSITCVGSGFLPGVLMVQWWPALPPRWSMLALLFLAGAGLWCWPRLRLMMALLLGAAWAAWRGSVAMEARLPRSLEGRDLWVSGQVANLPRVRPRATAFELRVDRAMLDGRPLALHGLLRLTWYDKAPPLPPCSRWRLVVRLKRPRAFLDPGGMDSERHALQRGIVAVGYVRKDAGHGPLASQGWCINRWRAWLADEINRRVPDRHAANVLRAFTIGDTRGLRQGDWALARANGVSHLIAISGFHIGVAAVFGIWLLRLLYACFPACGRYWPRPSAQAAAALLMACIYGALSGFGLPAVRTLLMIGVVALARCCRRDMGGVHVLVLALLVMLLWDPLAVLSAGFWLSFVGVAFLLLCLDGSRRSWRVFFRELGKVQWVMTVALMPLVLWFFGETSFIGMLSNLVAVPLCSLVIVPCALLGLLLLLVCPPLVTPVWGLAAGVVRVQWWFLAHMAALPGAHWHAPTVAPWALLLAMLGAWWLLLPRAMPLRALGAFLFLPLLWPAVEVPQTGAFRVYVLDVGQGLSLVLRTRHHALVYDAGARYPSGFDLGQAVVVPSLHALGIDRLDKLVISHADNDHSGGAAAVVAAFPHVQRLAGEPERMKLAMQPCLAGQAWTFDEVHFRVLYTRSAAPGQQYHNDHSCVLLVTGYGGRVLLTGDISRRIEPAVAAAVPSGAPLVLLVPHHGSQGSSSAAFIAALHPVLAVVSAGWRNRFGHPRPQVVRRYRQGHVPLFNTAVSGAVAVDFPRHGQPHVMATWRQRHRRYWRE